MAAQTFSLMELAGLLGVHRQTVATWLSQGCPYVFRGGRGKDWRLSLPDVVAWREQKAVEQAIGDTSKLDIDEARRRKVAAEAALAELELAKERGEVVAISVVSKVFGDQLSACRSRLVSLPAKVAPLVLPLNELNEIRDVLDSAVRETLDELVGYDADADAGGTGREADDGFVGGEAGEAEAAAETDGQSVGRSIQKAIGRGKRRTGTVEHRPQ